MKSLSKNDNLIVLAGEANTSKLRWVFEGIKDGDSTITYSDMDKNVILADIIKLMGEDNNVLKSRSRLDDRGVKLRDRVYIIDGISPLVDQKDRELLRDIQIAVKESGMRVIFVVQLPRDGDKTDMGVYKDISKSTCRELLDLADLILHFKRDNDIVEIESIKNREAKYIGNIKDTNSEDYISPLIENVIDILSAEQEYDTRGNVITRRTKYSNMGYEYDDNNRLIKQHYLTMDNEIFRTLTFDSSGIEIGVNKYGSDNGETQTITDKGNIIIVETKDSDGEIVNKVTNEKNDLGQFISMKIDRIDGSSSEHNTIYDDNGKIKTYSNSFGNIVIYEYNDNGKIIIKRYVDTNRLLLNTYMDGLYIVESIEMDTLSGDIISREEFKYNKNKTKSISKKYIYKK